MNVEFIGGSFATECRPFTVPLERSVYGDSDGYISQTPGEHREEYRLMFLWNHTKHMRLPYYVFKNVSLEDLVELGYTVRSSPYASPKTT